MLDTALTRRRLLVGAGVAGCSLLGNSSRTNPTATSSERSLTVGIATLGFGSLTNQQLAAELAQAGFTTIQLFLNQADSRYWKYNGRSGLSDLTEARCRSIAEAYRSKGIKIHSLGVYTNLICSDQAEREANLDYFAGMMQIAQWMEIPYLITEAGHEDSQTQHTSVAYHFQEPVWRQMIATGSRLAELAEDHQITVLFEPFYRGFFASAKRTRLFLEEVDSPRLRALLDPANLLEVNDLEEMFGQLGPWIDCIHAKDRKLHVDRGVAAGKGDLDYRKFASLAVERTPHAPVILEYVGASDYRQARRHLEDAMASEGIAIAS